MPPAFVLSQDQTLKFIPDLLKVVAYSKADPSSGPPNVRIDARTSSDPTPPSAHPFPLLHNLKQQSPAGLRPIGPTPSRARAYRPTNYPRQHPDLEHRSQRPGNAKQARRPPKVIPSTQPVQRGATKNLPDRASDQPQG